MAHPTIEQADAITQVTELYGKPDRIAIEHTMNAYGIMWLRWDSEPNSVLGDRNLFFDSNGELISWREIN